jgi:hypothetical protein
MKRGEQREILIQNFRPSAYLVDAILQARRAEEAVLA